MLNLKKPEIIDSFKGGLKMAFDYTLQVDLANQIKSIFLTVNNINLNDNNNYTVRKIDILRKKLNNLYYMVDMISVKGLGRNIGDFMF